MFKKNFIEEYLKMNNEKKSSDIIVKELIKKSIRQILKIPFNHILLHFVTT